MIKKNDLIALDDVKNDAEVQALLKAADDNFAAIGYKEHGFRHAQLAANIAGNVLKYLGFPERDCELARISAYMHDIGNAFGAQGHMQSGAVFTMDVLRRLGMIQNEIFRVINAIGCHEERDYDPHSPITAAAILGDKTDVHRTRVRKKNLRDFDMHDRVNYACERSFLRVDKEKSEISLELNIDIDICSVMNYFEIFLSRLHMAKKAARFLKCNFVLFINQDKFL
ncbi:MAG: HD domain-containing protein [bacterium]